MNILITGASSGIGRALVEEFCNKGYRVIGVSRNIERFKYLRDKLDECFDYVVADLSKIESYSNIVEKVRSNENIDILVNNAGFGLYRDVLEHGIDDIVSMAMVNFVAPLALIKLLLPYIPRKGIVVNIVTTGIHVLMKSLPIYGATKIALHYALKALRDELSKRGIDILNVYPGYIETVCFIKVFKFV